MKKFWETTKLVIEILTALSFVIGSTYGMVYFFEIRNIKREIESQKELINQLQAKTTKYEDWLIQYGIIRKIDGILYGNIERMEDVKRSSNIKKTDNKTATKSTTWVPITEIPKTTTQDSKKELGPANQKTETIQKGKVKIEVWPKVENLK